MTAIYWEWTELQTARLVLHNMSSAIIVFICKTKAVQYSHELTWRYWHNHVAPCHSMVQIMLINIVSSDDYFIFFTKFEENKIENFEKNDKNKENDNFSKFLSKIATFSKFSYNFVDLAHAISDGAVADDLVPRFIARSSATIVTTGCSVHSEVLWLFFIIRGDFIQILTYTLWDHWAVCPFAPAVSDMYCHIRPRPGVEPGFKVLVSFK